MHDSIYVRTLVIDNGTQRVAIVSADLLIIPPTVTALLEKELPTIDFTLDNTYLGSTHSHNSIGNWAQGVTSLLYGTYEDSIVRFIADKIKVSIEKATENLLPSIIKVDSVAMPEGVYNRVTDSGPVDPLIRTIKIERQDSSKLLFISYTAHATCLFSKDLVLSGDYPGKLTNTLESSGYSLAMFMAGAVGSHGPAAPEGGWSCVDWMAEAIAKKINANEGKRREMKNTTIEMHRVPLEMSEYNLKFFTTGVYALGCSAERSVNIRHLFLLCGSEILFYSVPPVIFRVSLMLHWIRLRQGSMSFPLLPVSTAAILATLHLSNTMIWITMKLN